MNIISIKNITLGIALAATTFAASAQKTITEGTAVYNVNAAGQDIEAKCYFKGDSSAYSFQQGPAKIELMGTVKNDFFVVLVDVPVANMKKAAVANPGELEESAGMIPTYTFTATADTKKIGDYNCKKFTAKDTKTGTSYDLWTTTDINLAPNIITRSFVGSSGTPIMFTIVQQGVTQVITLRSATEGKIPADTFKIASDYDKITMDDLKALSGGRH